MKSFQALKPKDEVIVSAYFHGSGFEISDPETLAHLLFASTKEDDQHIKLAFDGTAVTNGMSGLLFGSGLEDQCHAAKERVLDLLQQGKKVKLNCYGHSRGGVAALLLAQMLGGIDEECLEVNMTLLDPVPGNFLTTPHFDPLALTLAKQAMDLTKSRNLKRVLSLYGNRPFPAIIAHAPIFPEYPENTVVEEDVIPGAHADLQDHVYNATTRDVTFRKGGFIAFSRIRKFMQECGTSFDFSRVARYLWGCSQDVSSDTEDQTLLLNLYEKMLKSIDPNRKEGHAKKSLVILSDPSQPYLNQHHRQLSLAAGEEPRKKFIPDANGVLQEYSDCMLQIQRAPQIKLSPPLAVKPSSVELAALYQSFLKELMAGLSVQSQQSRKGELLQAFYDKALKIPEFSDEYLLKNALRTVIALALQRERNPHSIFSTTASGKTALALLRQAKYQFFAELILGCPQDKLRYRDLRVLVLGEDQEDYFSAKQRQETHDLLQDAASLSQHQQSHFLNRAVSQKVIASFRQAIKLAQKNQNAAVGYFDSRNDFVRALVSLKNKTIAEVQAGKLSIAKAEDLATKTVGLATAFNNGNLNLAMLATFEKETADYAVSWSWKMIVGAVIGAAIGVLVGAMLVMVVGPAAAVAAIYGGVQGAIYGAALLGASGAFFGGAAGHWLAQRKDPLAQTVRAATKKVEEDNAAIEWLLKEFSSDPSP